MAEISYVGKVDVVMKKGVGGIFSKRRNELDFETVT
jgi:hypothetical protein